jgi:hypothetical protein
MNILSFSYANEVIKLKADSTYQEKPVGIYKSMGGFCSDKAQEQQCAESAKKVAEANLENGFCTPDLQQKECTTSDGRVYKYDSSANQLERGLIKTLEEKNNHKKNPSSSPQ